MSMNYDQYMFPGAKVAVHGTYVGQLEKLCGNNVEKIWKINLPNGNALFEEEQHLKPLELWYEEQNVGGPSNLFSIKLVAWVILIVNIYSIIDRNFSVWSTMDLLIFF